MHQIAAHEYKGGEYTPIDLLLNPFWNEVAKILPVALAPNIITLIGLGFTICGTALILAYSPTMRAPRSSTFSGDAAVIPPYVFFANVLCVLIYQTCDAVDGKQARRTGMSSPVGQLVDHGCDTLVLFLQWLGIAATLGVGLTWYTSGALLAAQAAFFAAQLEEYHTNKLSWSVHGIFGVTEAQLLLAGLFFVTWILGQGIWSTSLWGSWALKDSLVVGQYGYSLIFILISTWKVVCNGNGSSGADKPVVSGSEVSTTANGENDGLGIHGTPMISLVNQCRKSVNGFQLGRASIPIVPVRAW